MKRFALIGLMALAGCGTTSFVQPAQKLVFHDKHQMTVWMQPEMIKGQGAVRCGYIERNSGTPAVSERYCYEDSNGFSQVTHTGKKCANIDTPEVKPFWEAKANEDSAERKFDTEELAANYVRLFCKEN